MNERFADAPRLLGQPPSIPLMPQSRPAATWLDLPGIARSYVLTVCIVGLAAVAWSMPVLGHFDSALLAVLFVLSIPISLVKVTLPGTASTLSLSHVLGYMALFALGTRSAVLVTAAGALTQCRFRTRQPSPVHKTLFSIATLALAMQMSGAVYVATGGRPGEGDAAAALVPFAAAVTVFFLLNTGLVAGAISLTTGQSLGRLWCDTFLPTWPAYLLGAAVSGASLFAAQRTGRWLVLFLTVPLGIAFYNLRAYLQRVDEATTDPLTMLPNQRFGLAHAAQELARARRHGTRMSVAIGDLDGLKAVNDRWGHRAGDLALRTVAQCLQSRLDIRHMCGRYGGDEFLAVLSECGRAEAAATCRTLQGAVGALEIGIRPDVFARVGISIGVAVYPDDGESLERLLEIADARMYENKLQRSAARTPSQE